MPRSSRVSLHFPSPKIHSLTQKNRCVIISDVEIKRAIFLASSIYSQRLITPTKLGREESDPKISGIRSWNIKKGSRAPSNSLEMEPSAIERGAGLPPDCNWSVYLTHPSLLCSESSTRPVSSAVLFSGRRTEVCGHPSEEFEIECNIFGTETQEAVYQACAAFRSAIPWDGQRSCRSLRLTAHQLWLKFELKASAIRLHARLHTWA